MVASEVAVVIAILLASLMIVHKARGEAGVPPYATYSPGKVCVAVFEKHEIIRFECNLPKVQESGKKEPIRKGE